MADKSTAAQRVLELMDSVEDGADRFSEFVDHISLQTGYSREQIKDELKNFI